MAKTADPGKIRRYGINLFAMGIRCEWASLDGTGVARDEWLSLAQAVEREAIGLLPQRSPSPKPTHRLASHVFPVCVKVEFDLQCVE